MNFMTTSQRYESSTSCIQEISVDNMLCFCNFFFIDNKLLENSLFHNKRQHT